MPKKIKPRTDHRSQHLLSTFNEILYSAEDIANLSKMVNGIDDLDEFQERLERAADIYRIHKNNFDDAPTDAELRAALTILNDHSKGLLDTLQNLDSRSWSWVLAPELEAKMKAIRDGQAVSLSGRQIVKEVLPDGSKIIETLDPNDFVEMAQLIHQYINQAFERLPRKGKPGQRNLHALS